MVKPKMLTAGRGNCIIFLKYFEIFLFFKKKSKILLHDAAMHHIHLFFVGEKTNSIRRTDKYTWKPNLR